MRRVFLFISVMLCIAGAAAAQDFPKMEVFGGYSMQRLGYSDVSAEELSSAFDYYGFSGDVEMKRFLKAGFIGSVAYNFTEVMGIEADFRWNAGDILTGSFDFEGIPVSAKARYSDFAFLVGPKFSLRKSDTFTPFAHALIGVDRTKISVKASAQGTSESDDLGTDTGFGLALGGGLDVNVNKNFGIRVIQADYFLAKHFDENMNNLSIAFGAVFRF